MREKIAHSNCFAYEVATNGVFFIHSTSNTILFEKAAFFGTKKNKHSVSPTLTIHAVYCQNPDLEMPLPTGTAVLMAPFGLPSSEQILHHTAVHTKKSPF